jgi:hypothetical protein
MNRRDLDLILDVVMLFYSDILKIPNECIFTSESLIARIEQELSGCITFGSELNRTYDFYSIHFRQYTS